MRYGIQLARDLGRVAAVVALCLASFASAGTTGKLSGAVTDESDAPLPGAAVTVRGTRLGASTDADGRYLILQVPPGQHTLDAHLIGYGTTAATRVTVNADRTTVVEMRLIEEVMEVGAVIVVAKRPAIEADVTSSQIVVDAEMIAQAPVKEMLDYLSYEPGVAVNAQNNLNIRGGYASEVRFQVDGLDRADALTGNAYTQLNQVMVAEVTVLTGGFNAEYGNVRSGMVNVVTRDGTERGFGLPWAAGVFSWAPAQQKHFGPGAYDRDQYDYRLMSSASPLADSALTGPIYWPDLYESTRSDSGMLAMREADPGFGKVFDGWASRANSANSKDRGKGSYGSNEWTAEHVRDAWEWEANMDEQVWQYGHRPDLNLDLAAGWALPNKLGGLIVGYRYAREMTAIPALLPYNIDRSMEAKLTLTPIDNLKVTFSYLFGEGEGTGGGTAGSASANAELASSGAITGSVDPVQLRGTGQLIGSVNAVQTENTKYNLSYNGPLTTDFTTFGSSLTYTLASTTFMTAAVSWSESNWDVSRDLPRVDVNDFEDARYAPTSHWGYQTWLKNSWDWSDTVDAVTGVKDGIVDLPGSLADATTPGRRILKDPFDLLYGGPYREVPTEGKFITREFEWVEEISPGVNDTTRARVVSPQGWIQEPYRDLSGVYTIAGGGDAVVWGGGKGLVLRTDLTHATEDHTLKGGIEYISGDLEYNQEVAKLYSGLRNSKYRQYGGNMPPAQPSLIGIYVQDKYESEGMIANVGVRAERYFAGQEAYLYDDLFNTTVFSQSNGAAVFDQLAGVQGWKDEWGTPSHYAMLDRGLVPPTPADVTGALPRGPAKTYWRIMPRFGISHPVSDHTKFFFNYGVFYSQQKSAMRYGTRSSNRLVGKIGRFENLYNPNLRPASTTMYEVGVEHLFPLGLVAAFRGYAKYNTDIVSVVTVEGSDIVRYVIVRNPSYSDVRGAEIKIARSAGRFLNGWLTYEKNATRSGQVGFEKISNDPLNVIPYLPFTKGGTTQGSFRGMLRLGTPSDWGPVAGGWSVSVIQSYRSGDETVYNFDQVPAREVPEENYVPVVDFWNTDVKFAKSIALPGGRSMSAYLDISNVLNTKRLDGNFVNGDEYGRYLIGRRRSGDDVKYGDESTFYVFTEPYKDAAGTWKPPISPRTDWLHHLNPRYFRFGVRFNL